MLSEIVANRVALEARPTTPALRDEEIDMNRLSGEVAALFQKHYDRGFNANLTNKSRSNFCGPSVSKKDDVNPIVSRGHEVFDDGFAVSIRGHATHAFG